IHLANFIQSNDSLLKFSFGLSMTILGETSLAKALESNQNLRHLKINNNISTTGAKTLLNALINRTVPLDTFNVGYSTNCIANAAILEPLLARGTSIHCSY